MSFRGYWQICVRVFGIEPIILSRVPSGTTMGGPERLSRDETMTSIHRTLLRQLPTRDFGLALGPSASIDIGALPGYTELGHGVPTARRKGEPP